MENYLDTVLSQYTNSPILLKLIGEINAAIDPATDITAFYDLVWNVDTAQGYGLDVWGRIVGVPRQLTVPGGKTFGYDEAGKTSVDPFGQSAFFGGSPATQNYTMDDTTFRSIVLLKALMNLSHVTVRMYNSLLMTLFPGRGNAYVSDYGATDKQYIAVTVFAEAADPLAVGFNQAPLDGNWDRPPVYTDTGGMNIRLTFEFLLEPLELALLTQSGLIPRPTGVAMEILDLDLPNVFGFTEAGYSAASFGTGAFLSGFGIPAVDFSPSILTTDDGAILISDIGGAELVAQ